MTDYKYIVYSVDAMVQQISCCYMGRPAYRYWLSGVRDHDKDPFATDRRFIEEKDWNINISVRHYRELRDAGEARQAYLRLEPEAGGNYQWVVLSTEGTGKFFDEEEPRHFSHHPLVVGPYQISRRRAQDGNQHAWVALNEDEIGNLRAMVLELALKWSARRLAGLFWTLPYQGYWGVNRQLYKTLRMVNEIRETAGLEIVGETCINTARDKLKPYDVEQPVAEKLSPRRTEPMPTPKKRPIGKARPKGYWCKTREVA